MEPSAVWSLIEKHRSLAESERHQIDEYLSWYSSDFWSSEAAATAGALPYGQVVTPDDDSDLSMETNYLFAFIDTMIANVCPQNPQVTINAKIEDVSDFAKANQNLINDTIRSVCLYDLLWEGCSWAGIAGRGIFKTVWDFEKKRPAVHVIDPRAFFYDFSRRYEYARYVCEVVPITEAEWKARLKRGSGFKYNKDAAERVVPSGYPRWLDEASARLGSSSRDAAKEHFRWVLIYEFYDLVSNKYYHFGDGSKEPLLVTDLPFKYKKNPYTLLVFNKNMRNNSGLSDAKLIAPQQRRLNELDSLELRHAHTSVPITVANTAYMDDPEEFISAINSDNGPNDIITFRSSNPVPIESILGSTRAPSLSPSFDKMRERLVSQIEFTLGIPQYSRGVVGASDVATELALADTATRTRNGRRIAIVSAAVREIAVAIGALWQQHMGSSPVAVRVDPDGKAYRQIDATDLGYVIGYEPGGKPIINTYALWDDSVFEIEVVAYSPSENHRLVQLNKAQTFMPVLLQHPNVNQKKLVHRLLDMLGFEDMFTEAPPAPPPGQPQPGQPQPGADLQAGTPASMLGGGGEMPAGLEDIEASAPVDFRSMAQQSKMEF